jgi:hypothetical protein
MGTSVQGRPCCREAAVVDFVDCLNAPAPRQADAGQGRSLRPVKAESEPEPTIGLFEIAHNGKFTRLQHLGAAQGGDRPIGSQPSESGAAPLLGKTFASVQFCTDPPTEFEPVSQANGLRLSFCVSDPSRKDAF